MKTRAALAVGILAVLLVGLWATGERLSAPAPSVVGPPPPALNARSVIISTTAGHFVSGWFARGIPRRGAVLLLHGIRSDRRQMLNRALALHAVGYSVLLIDLPSHGESSGNRITFGYREAEGVRASLRFLDINASGERTAVVGVSQGAAAFVLADAPGVLSAVVLESMYSTIEQTLANRLQLRAGSLAVAFAPLFMAQLPMRLGVSAAELRPIDHVAGLQAPVLIAVGTEDLRTTVAETQRIFDAAARPKELWLVDGAGHVDLYGFNPRAYEARVFAFLARCLAAVG